MKPSWGPLFVSCFCLLTMGCTPRTRASYPGDVLASLLMQRAPLTRGGIDSKVRLVLKDGRRTAELDASSLCVDEWSVFFCGEEELIRAVDAGEVVAEPRMRILIRDLARADARYWDPFQAERDARASRESLEVLILALEVTARVVDVAAKTTDLVDDTRRRGRRR